MTTKTRILYFSLWRAACAAQGWDERDADRRHDVTRYCMREIRAMETDSITQLGNHEITALFALLRHYAAPLDLKAAGEWAACCENYQDVNRVRQVKHKLGRAGRAGGRLDEQRFGGELASEFPAALPSPKTVRDMCITAGARAYRLDKSRRFEAKPVTPAVESENPF